LEDEDEVHLDPILGDLAAFDLDLVGSDLAAGHAAQRLGRALDGVVHRVLKALRRRRNHPGYSCYGHTTPPVVGVRVAESTALPPGCQAVTADRSTRPDSGSTSDPARASLRAEPARIL